MFTPEDSDQFLHLMACDGGYIIVQKDNVLENNQNNFYLIKSDFEHSVEYTRLKCARDLCHELLSLMGVRLQDKETGLTLAIEVVKNQKKTKQAGMN